MYTNASLHNADSSLINHDLWGSGGTTIVETIVTFDYIKWTFKDSYHLPLQIHMEAIYKFVWRLSTILDGDCLSWYVDGIVFT
jgi:hypothetical protein